ncbi:hypothetical protein KUTeg_020115 [Tegillarca granosa]|uniref:Leucine-rich repeat-containing protein 74B n=1 Tax=Tegillarca granosa TaxID=220873 RepID=A0ABQ9E6V4_TEGGR|nr:hypothetical protein KUTeg_020115 [Tegillarca granosa]
MTELCQAIAEQMKSKAKEHDIKLETHHIRPGRDYKTLQMTQPLYSRPVLDERSKVPHLILMYIPALTALNCGSENLSHKDTTIQAEPSTNINNIHYLHLMNSDLHFRMAQAEIKLLALLVLYLDLPSLITIAIQVYILLRGDKDCGLWTVVMRWSSKDEKAKLGVMSCPFYDCCINNDYNLQAFIFLYDLYNIDGVLRYRIDSINRFYGRDSQNSYVLACCEVPILRSNSTMDKHQDSQSPDGTKGDKFKVLIRPHSAKFKRQPSDETAEISKNRPRRPWSAQAKTRSDVSTKRVVRQNLRKPHLRPPKRCETPSSTDSGALAAVGLENVALKTYTAETLILPSTKKPDNLDHGVRTLISVTPKPGWELTKIPDEDEEDDDREKRKEKKKKKHPTFDSWLVGSPHDSDEYDTDLETELLKNLEEEKEKKKKQEDKLVDPTGVNAYQEQCQKEGIVPVSFLVRHLGDRNLRMRHHYLGGHGAKPIARALELNTVTENLDLGDNYLEPEGAVHLSRMLKDNTFIVYLDISNNFIGSRGAAAVADMMEVNTTLKSLSLAGNQLTDNDAYMFIDALKNNISLTSLDLSNNDFGELGGMYIGGALGINESLYDLDLSWNSIRNRGAEAIANALNLNLNPMGDEGLEAILNAISQQQSLHYVSMEETKVSSDNHRKIQEIIESGRDITILHGGVGGYQRFSSETSVLKLLCKFLREHRSDLENAFSIQDKDHMIF